MPDIPIFDAVIVAVYMILSFIFGLYATKFLKTGSGEEGYFLAGRKMPGWLNGISTAVTAMNADVAPAYCGMAVVVGLPIAWFYLSRFGFALMLAGLLFAIFWRRMGISTGPEFYAIRFSGRGGIFVRMWTSVFSVFIGMVPWIGAGMLGVHLIFGPIFHIDSKAVTLAIILPVLLLYVWISGFAGVLVTDLIQTIIIVVANLTAGILVLVHYGGPTGLADAITNTIGLPSNEILSIFPAPGHQILGPLIVVLWFLVPTIGAGGGQSTEGQRVFSCKNEAEAAKVYIWSEVMLFLMLLLLTLPALGLLPIHPELYTADPAEREQAYGMMLHTFLPTGILGLALAALTASVMSTIDSHLNYGAQTLTNDFWRTGKKCLEAVTPKKTNVLLFLTGILMAACLRAYILLNTSLFNGVSESVGTSALGAGLGVHLLDTLINIAFFVPLGLFLFAGLWVLFVKTPDKKALLVGKVFTVLIMFASIAVVYQADSLIGIAVKLAGIFGSSATLGWAQWWWWRVNFYSWVGAVIGGPIIYFGLSPFLGMIPWWQETGAQGPAALQYLGMIQALVAMIVSTVFWVSLTMITAPEKMERLIDFYKRARPLGFWTPVKLAIIAQEGPDAIPTPPSGMIAGGFGAAILGTSWVSLAILSLSQLYVGQYMWGIVLAISSVLTAWAFKKAFRWHFARMANS